MLKHRSRYWIAYDPPEGISRLPTAKWAEFLVAFESGKSGSTREAGRVLNGGLQGRTRKQGSDAARERIQRGKNGQRRRGRSPTMPQDPVEEGTRHRSTQWRLIGPRHGCGERRSPQPPSLREQPWRNGTCGSWPERTCACNSEPCTGLCQFSLESERAASAVPPGPAEMDAHGPGTVNSKHAPQGRDENGGNWIQ